MSNILLLFVVVEESSLNPMNLLLEGGQGRFSEVMAGQKKRKQSVGEKRLEKVKYFI